MNSEEWFFEGKAKGLIGECRVVGFYSCKTNKGWLETKNPKD